MGRTRLQHSDTKIRRPKNNGLKKRVVEKETKSAREISKWGIHAYNFDNPSHNPASYQKATVKVVDGGIVEPKSLLFHPNGRASTQNEIKDQGRRKLQNTYRRFRAQVPPVQEQVRLKQANKGRNYSSERQKRVNGAAKGRASVRKDLIHNMSNVPDFLQLTERQDSFQDRALSFGVLDWSLLERWNHDKGLKEKRGNCPSSSGSDTSSSSTMGSSTFSRRSESRHRAKREVPPFESLNPSLKFSSVLHFVKPQYRNYTSPSPPRNRFGGLRSLPREPSLIEQECKDGNFASHELLDFRLLEDKIVKNQLRSPSRPEAVASNPLKRIQRLGPRHLECAYCSHHNESDSVMTEVGADASFRHLMEQNVSGSESPCFFSAGEASPETGSEVSVNPSYTLQQPDEKTNRSFEVTLNARENHLAARQNGNDAPRSINGSTKQASQSNLYVSETLARDRRHQTCKRVSAKGNTVSTCSKNTKDNLDLKVAGKTKKSFRKGASVSSDHSEGTSPQNFKDRQTKNQAPKPPTKPVTSTRYLPKAMITRDASIGCRSNTKRRSKSFCAAVNGVSPKDDDLARTVKSLAIRPENSPCQLNLSKNGCKNCKKPSVSPLRRLIDPLVKSRGKHKRNLSLTPIRSILTQTKETPETSPAEACAATLNKTSCVRLSFSDGQPSGVLHNQDSSPSLGSRCNSPGPKEEAVFKEQFGIQFDMKSNTEPVSLSYKTVCQGLLHFMYRGGLPYFTFSLNDSDEIFAAKTWKKGEAGGKNFDWVYSFYSGKIVNKKKHKAGWVSWGKKDFKVPTLVGNMLVSSSLSLKSNNSRDVEHFVETEFVLSSVGKRSIHDWKGMGISANKDSFPSQIACRRDYASDVAVHDSLTDLTKIGKCNVPISDYVRTPGHRLKKKADASRTLFRQSFSEPCGSTLVYSETAVRKTADGTEGGESDYIDAQTFSSSPFCSHLQLAAIIVRIPFEPRESVKSEPPQQMVPNKPGGWGLKFLEKISAGQATENSASGPTSKWDNDNHLHSFRRLNSSPERSLTSDDALESSSTCSSNMSEGNTSVSVIVPAGIHGLPKTGPCQPSSLVERWKSGGGCDCHGWDLGCPLTILDNRNPPEGTVEAESFHPSELYVKGTKERRPALSLTMVHDSLYLLSFHEPLSPLQAFSTGIAMLHSREPLMSVKKLDLQEGYYETAGASLAEQATTMLHAISTPQDDFPMGRQKNNNSCSMQRVPARPLSPYGRV